MKSWLWSFLLMPRALGFWGAVIGAGIAYLGARQNNRDNQASAQSQMAFQEEMANTQHQREVRDLRAAGLNPVLSGTGGMGAAAPSGAGYVAQNELGAAASTGMQAAQLKEQLMNIRQDTKVKEQTEKLLLEQTREAHENIYKRYWEATSNEYTAKILAEELKGKKLEGEIDTTKFGEIMRYLNRVIPGLNSGSSAYRNLR